MGQRTVLLWGAAVCLVGAVCTSAAGEQTTPRAVAAKMKNPVAANPASGTSGQQLFQKYCRVCHGATGRGDSPSAPKDMQPSNLTDATWDRGSTDGEIFTVIMEGAGPDYKMKGLKGKLPDENAWHIVNYVRSLAGAAPK